MNSLILAVIITNTVTGVILHPVKDEATHAMLRAVARDNDPVEREAAQAALDYIAATALPARAPAPPPVDVDLKYLNDPLVGRQQQAVETIKRRGLDATPCLPLLASPDSALRRSVCETIHDVPALARQLATDEDPFVQRAAADRLLALHNDAARAALLTLRHNERAAVRAEAARVLGEWAEPALAVELHPLLKDPAPAVARAAAEALGRLRNPVSVPPLLERIASAPALAQERMAWALGEFRAGTPALLALLNAGDDAVEAAAAEALGKIGDRQAVVPLRGILTGVNNHGSGARLRALAALQALGDRESVKQVLPIVTDRVLPPLPFTIERRYETDEVRIEALRYLAAAGDARVGEKLLTGFTDLPSYPVRVALAETVRTLLGQPYLAVFSENVRHYNVESLAPSRYPWTPAVPGVTR